MKKASLGLVLFVILGCAAAAFADDGPTLSVPLSSTRQFASMGTIYMDLSGGDYSVRAADIDQIHVTGTCGDPERQHQMRADIRIHGSEARIVTGGPHNNSHFTIEVPRHSNLIVRLTAGELSIDRVEGDLNVSSHAGDVNISVGKASDYRLVKASVYAGDVNAPNFGGSTSGLFRSLRWSGSGRYTIQAHVGAGDLNLLSEQ